MKMLRLGEEGAVLIAFGMPPIMIDVISDTEVSIEGSRALKLNLDQAIQMVEESVQANLDQALTLLARRIKEEDVGYGGA